MPLTVFFALLTLAPLVMALVLVGFGLARRATSGLALGLSLVGVVIPIIGLALLAPEVSAGFPLEIALLGDQTSWLALYGRADALSIYAAIGVAVIVAPLLIWIAWRAAPLDADQQAAIAAEAAEAGEAGEAEDAADAEMDADVEIADAGADEAAPVGIADWLRGALGRWQWAGVALALALESLTLWLCFAENIVLLGIVWVALIVVAWALGELGSESAIFDWRGLGLMVIGPIVWLATVLLIAGQAGARLLLDLTGAARLPTGHLIVISLALAFAAGAYPAVAWLRKRASIATPAGLAAAALVVMPAALFVGARTFSIGATTANGWPALSVGVPPITVGVALSLLGAISVAVAGLLALGRRDPRSLLAMLTLAQAGWGLVGLGVGAPFSLLGVVLLLATSVIGLGAVIAALVAAGAITADLEPDSAGPRILGEPLRPTLMFAWLVGVASLVGTPLFAGFAAQQLISDNALTGPRLGVPLVALAWFGSALLAIALTRATAPAFSAPLIAVYDETDGELADATEAEADAAPVVATAGMTAADDDAGDEADDDEAMELDGRPVAETPELRLEELPGVALGVLALLAGIAPGVALTLASGAAGATMQSGALDALAPSSSGYAAGVGQWFATAPVIFIVIGALALAYVRSRMPRQVRPIFLAGQSSSALAEAATTDDVAIVSEGKAAAVEAEDAEVAESEADELVGLPEPAETWRELRSAQRSFWLTPVGGWLGLNGDDILLADDVEVGEDGEDEEGADEVDAAADAELAQPGDEDDEVDEADETAPAEAPEPAKPVKSTQPVADAQGAAEGARASETAQKSSQRAGQRAGQRARQKSGEQG